jgi:hypothetical protein
MENSLLELPLLLIEENEKSFFYSRGYTKSGLPYYIPPNDKNTGIHAMDEVLFLPITLGEFRNNNDDYFFGYRFLIAVTNQNTVALEGLSDTSVTNVELHYEITRIRYYPDGVNKISINRTYDAIFPTQIVPIEYFTSEIMFKVGDCIMEIINHYCNWYLGKRI